MLKGLNVSMSRLRSWSGGQRTTRVCDVRVNQLNLPTLLGVTARPVNTGAVSKAVLMRDEGEHASVVCHMPCPPWILAGAVSLGYGGTGAATAGSKPGGRQRAPPGSQGGGSHCRNRSVKSSIDYSALPGVALPLLERPASGIRCSLGILGARVASRHAFRLPWANAPTNAPVTAVRYAIRYLCRHT